MATKERKFCVVNFQKAHRGDLKGLQFEANRSAEEVERNPFAFNVNIDAKRTDSNKFLRRSDDWHSSVTEIIDAAGVTEKSDSVVAVTGVVAFSEDWPGAGDPEKVDAYLEDALDWAENKLGLKVFNAVIHYDETSTHLQFAGVPIVEQPVYVREVRKDEDGLMFYGKERNGKKGRRVYDYKLDENGNRIQKVDAAGNPVVRTSLSAKYLLGGRRRLSSLQDSFYENVGRKHGLKRGACRIEERIADGPTHQSEAESRRKQRENIKKREGDVEKREADLVKREADLVKRAGDVASREMRVATREADLVKRENKVRSDEAEVLVRENRVSQREDEMKRSEAEVSAKKQLWSSPLKRLGLVCYAALRVLKKYGIIDAEQEEHIRQARFVFETLGDMKDTGVVETLNGDIRQELRFIEAERTKPVQETYSETGGYGRSRGFEGRSR